MRWLRLTKRTLLLALLGFAGFLAWGYGRNHPQDVPWAPLDLAQPVGAFTRAKLAELEPAQCRALLRRAGIRFAALPDRSDGPECGYQGAVRLRGGAATIGYAPASLGTSCPVAAALALWEWHVVQPAALRRFGRRVERVETFGSYSCRRLYGRRTGQWSEHARANAVDIAAFRLEGGRRIPVLDGWRDPGADGAFLRDVRDGACRLFATTLSPDYNAAHRDHLHLDEAGRGAAGWRVCR
ncbi:MAG: extensin family protein [Alphaproteobacteria bacterium]|nr:extensin family protein [Alphaproteobacteria bacterium]MBV9372975.1 extensin family protein [Alphaproteobacteria bacterium]MBV9901342.1 extensin family protein [Alphaproteobacteria bacterium]